MEKIVTIQQKKINGKMYLVPEYNLYGCQKYMLPKLDNAPVHHTFFNPHDINQLYKQKNLDPQQLDCKLKFNQNYQQINQSIGKNSNIPEEQSTKLNFQQSFSYKNNEQLHKIRVRPKMRQNGLTHFIHIPLTEQIGETFDNLIKPQIQQENQDLLVNKNSLHATILTFRLRCLQDLPKWQKIIKSVNLKKAKVYIKGVDIFPVKKNYTKVLYLNINGLEDIIDTIISKAIQQNLVKQKELQFTYFDKQTQSYKIQKQHVTIIKTKGDDLIDATNYLKFFGKINLGKININSIAMSMIGSFDGENYFNEIVNKLE